MARLSKRCLWTVVSLQALLLLAAVLVMPRDAGSDASGCTRFDNSAPTWGACVQAQGQACYYCEYSYSGGGWSECHEDESGATSYCIDHQN